MATYLTPDEVDEWLKLPRGKSARLARRGLMPAIILPDKSIRFDKDALALFLGDKCSGQQLEAAK